MTKFQIENTVSATVLGIFIADTEAQALDLMAVDAGYKSYADLQAQVPAQDGEIVVAALPAFEDDDKAKEAIRNLVVELISVAEECGQTPQDWDDISCDGSLDDVLKDLGAQYLAATRYGDDYDLRDEIVEYATSVTADLLADKPDQLGADIKFAKDLSALRSALVAADAYAAASNLNAEAIYDATALPTFGGAAIDQKGVFSWDENYVLTGFGEWTIIPRGEDVGETVHQENGVVIGDTEYRRHDRYYLGRDQIDTIRFARWVETEDGNAQVFSGYIDIVAFPRDRVLKSELIAAIEQRESELHFEDGEDA